MAKLDRSVGSRPAILRHRVPGRFATTLLGLLASALMLPVAASGQSIPDATCPPFGGANFVSSGFHRWAHVVTPQLTGKLTAAEVRFTRNPGDPVGDYELRISDLDSAGVPTNNVIGTAVIPDAAVAPGSINAPVTGTFAVPVSVVAGRRYGLIVTRPAAGAGGAALRIEGRASPTDGCEGSFFLSSDQDDPFVDQSPSNLVYATFVDPVPTVSIAKRPKKKSKKRKARFSFSSNEAGVRFECKLDKRPFQPCNATRTFRKLTRRRHKLEVQAIDQVGSISSPASFSWKVKKP